MAMMKPIGGFSSGRDVKTELGQGLAQQMRPRLIFSLFQIYIYFFWLHIFLLAKLAKGDNCA